MPPHTVDTDPGPDDYSLTIDGVKTPLKKVGIEDTRAIFQDPAGNRFVLTNDILIGFADESSDEEREALLARFPGEVVERKGAVWKFRVSDPGEDAPLVLANELTDEGIVRYAEPNALQAPTLHRDEVEP